MTAIATHRAVALGMIDQLAPGPRAAIEALEGSNLDFVIPVISFSATIPTALKVQGIGTAPTGTVVYGRTHTVELWHGTHGMLTKYTDATTLTSPDGVEIAYWPSPASRMCTYKIPLLSRVREAFGHSSDLLEVLPFYATLFRARDMFGSGLISNVGSSVGLAHWSFGFNGMLSPMPIGDPFADSTLLGTGGVGSIPGSPSELGASEMAFYVTLDDGTQHRITGWYEVGTDPGSDNNPWTYLRQQSVRSGNEQLLMSHGLAVQMLYEQPAGPDLSHAPSFAEEYMAGR